MTPQEIDYRIKAFIPEMKGLARCLSRRTRLISAGFSREDLFQVGLLGALECLQKKGNVPRSYLNMAALRAVYTHVRRPRALDFATGAPPDKTGKRCYQHAVEERLTLHWLERARARVDPERPTRAQKAQLPREDVRRETLRRAMQGEDFERWSTGIMDVANHLGINQMTARRAVERTFAQFRKVAR